MGYKIVPSNCRSYTYVFTLLRLNVDIYDFAHVVVHYSIVNFHL
jgi:hypothetical protein